MTLSLDRSTHTVSLLESDLVEAKAKATFGKPGQMGNHLGTPKRSSGRSALKATKRLTSRKMSPHGEHPKRIKKQSRERNLKGNSNHSKLSEQHTGSRERKQKPARNDEVSQQGYSEPLHS